MLQRKISSLLRCIICCLNSAHPCHESVKTAKTYVNLMRNCSNDPPCYVGVSGTAGLLNPSLDSPGVAISYLSLPGTEAPQHDPPRPRSDPGLPRPPPQFYLKIVICFNFVSCSDQSMVMLLRGGNCFNLYHIKIARDCYLKGTENYFYCSHLSEI